MSDARDPWAELERLLLGDADRDAMRVAAEAGVDFEQARALWRALGFPPIPDHETYFTRRDAEVLHAATELARSGVSDQRSIVHMARVIGQALSRVAEAQITLAMGRLAHATAEAEPADGEPGDGPQGEPAASPNGGAFLSPELVRQLEEFLGYVWRRHLLAAARRETSRAPVPTDGAPVETVGFADLVGYTAISRGLEPQKLAELLDRFEELVYAHVPHAGGRVVKMIGDEVMFVADDAAQAASAALSLVEACRAHDELPELRAGLATGPVLPWAGDLFGPTVNLASRLVEVARPDTVLASEETAAALQDQPDLALRRLHRMALGGIGRVRAFAVRRAEPRPADERR
jgi:adenylate cyclase